MLVKYLQDYAKVQEDAGRIQYSTSVLSIAKAAAAADGDAGFELTLSKTSTGGNLVLTTVKCEVVVVASGLSVYVLIRSMHACM